MEKALLLTVSEDVSCMYAARFVSSFFSEKSNVVVTLFHDIPKDHVKQGSEAEKQARKTLEKAHSLLLHRGFAPERIICKLECRHAGTVKDIVAEGNAGKYDAVVLGRRGYAVFETFLASSVSRNMLDERIVFPLWICRRPDEKRKNVLLAADGSASSLRVADHVGFVLEDEEEHSVTVLHIDTGNGTDADAVVAETVTQLKNNHIPDERIEIRIIKSQRVASTIIEQAAYHAAVAVGRVGQAKSGLNGWLVGSRTMKLLECLEGSALWVSR